MRRSRRIRYPISTIPLWPNGGLGYRPGRRSNAPISAPSSRPIPNRERPKMLDIIKNNEKSFADGKILKSVTEGVGVVTFNNPEKRNAMSLDMWEGFGHALVELRDDPDVRVVILVGAGDKAFVAGADITQFENTRHTPQPSEEYSKRSAAQRALLADYPN